MVRDKGCPPGRFRVMFWFTRPPGFSWPGPCSTSRVNRIAYNVSGKSGVYHTALVPANHSEETRFGLIDGAVIVFFLLCVGGFICFLVA